MPLNELMPMGERAERGPLDSYVTVLVMLAVTFFFVMAMPDSRWSVLATTAMQGVTLVVLMWVSRTPRSLRVATVALLLLAAVTGLVGWWDDTDTGTGLAGVTTALLAATGPVLIFRGIRRRTLHIDVETVAAALSIYLMIGLFYSYVYGAIQDVHPPFFAQADDATRPELLYFSFITMTTVGYGDFSPVSNAGRALAVSEAVLGQIYLVTIVALIVGNLGRPSPRARREEALDDEAGGRSRGEP